MSDFEVKQLAKKDALDYRNIRLEMLQREPEAYGSSYEDNIKLDINFFEDRIKEAPIYGAFKNKKLIGTAGYYLDKNSKCMHWATIWGMYINKNYRGNGFSNALLEKILNNLPDYVEQIGLSVMVDKKEAYNLYKKFGFEQYGYEKNALKIDGKYYDEILMIKFLNNVQK